LEGHLTELLEENERLMNENRQLRDTIVDQNITATNDLANKDAEIERISHLLRTTENDRDGKMNVSRQRVMDLEAERLSKK
jgi:regulator of replication initiation timing